VNDRRQLKVLLILVAIDALCALLTYAFFMDQLTAMAGIPMPDMNVSNGVLGLANAGIVFVVYGCAGLLGYRFARRLGLPGVFREDGDWKPWFVRPLFIGLGCGVFLVLGDLLFAPHNGMGRFPHPGFPVSILASLSAGIGEEILFRGFVFGIWALILNRLLGRYSGRSLAMVIANGIAALAFGAGHLGTVLVLTGASSVSELSPVLLLEIFFLNGVVGLIAGHQYMKDGLVAAAGVHFWADVVFHVLYGLT
jgi:membrane protease YdiL (CAAX protease family)